MGVKKFSMALAALAATVLLAGCSGGSASESASQAAGNKVGFLVFNQELDSFVTVMVDAVTAGASAQGLDLTTVDGKGDLKTQEAAMDQFIADGVDAILIYPGDPTSLVPDVQKAADADIPVFTVNLGLEKQAPVVTYVGSDDFTYGKEQGELVAKALGDAGGKVALLEGVIGTSAQINRTAGFKEALKAHPNITIVEEVPDNWNPQTSSELVQQFAQKYPKGQLNAVVAQGPQVVGAAEWAKANGREEIVFVAGDYNSEVQSAIESGAVYGTTDQNPKKQGEEAITAVANWIGGKQDLVETPAHITPLPVITKENASTTEPAW